LEPGLIGNLEEVKNVVGKAAEKIPPGPAPIIMMSYFIGNGSFHSVLFSLL
jgi:hypothetical protein